MRNALVITLAAITIAVMSARSVDAAPIQLRGIAFEDGGTGPLTVSTEQIWGSYVFRELYVGAAHHCAPDPDAGTGLNCGMEKVRQVEGPGGLLSVLSFNDRPPVSVTSNATGDKHTYLFRGGTVTWSLQDEFLDDHIVGTWTGTLIEMVITAEDGVEGDSFNSDSTILATFGEGLLSSPLAEYLGVGFRRTSYGHFLFSGDSTIGNLQDGHRLSTNSAEMFISAPEPSLFALMLPAVAAFEVRRRMRRRLLRPGAQ